jgi:predicted ATP-dependent endonuclease of OLD family
LAVEEPELYQHPNRQRHFARILLQLSSGKTPGVAENTQVIYSTHSPLFVGIDRMDQIRLLRKARVTGKPKITKVVSATTDDIAEILWRADGEPGAMYSGETLLPRLQSIMTPWMSEGFFARVAVLVEGEDDRASVLGMARAMGHDLESAGFSVIPCGGKVSMDRPTAIFQRLGIPVYLIWDSDFGEKDAKAEDNRRLLRLLRYPAEDWPNLTTATFACFKKNLETTLREELGPEDFDRWLAECQENLRIPKRKHALKNPQVIMTIIQTAEAVGKTSQSLRKICHGIIALG